MDPTGLMTISEMSSTFGISTRMLRYYEQVGLLASTRRYDYAYRVYDENAVRRLKQIIVLRKLRISVKQMTEIFGNNSLSRAVDIFLESIGEIDSEMTALNTIRRLLIGLVARLSSYADNPDGLNTLQDDDILEAISALNLSDNRLRGESDMENLNGASEKLAALKNVRILHLPPMTVAAYNYFGENPEDNALKVFNEFVMQRQLQRVKPDLRVLGFNNPSPRGNETYGYEFWVTIPEGMDVPEPLKKLHFAGGLYAAHCIRMGDLHEWQLLDRWVKDSEEYDYDEREPYGMGGCLEEHLNAFTYYENGARGGIIQLDLMIPVKPRRK